MRSKYQYEEWKASDEALQAIQQTIAERMQAAAHMEIPSHK